MHVFGWQRERVEIKRLGINFILVHVGKGGNTLKRIMAESGTKITISK